jgi:GT2 family glycosyltransferase
MIRERFPHVKLIENSENLGFSKGNNIGVLAARGEYVCILNPDTVVAEDTFKELLDCVEKNENLGIVGCRLIDGTGQFLPESKRNIPVVKVALQKLLGRTKYYYANHLAENDEGSVPIMVGAFMFLQKKIYDESGGFDEDYFMYGEDIDLSYRVQKLGYSNYYYGKITAIHFKGESTLRDKNHSRRFYGAMHIFYDKHFGKNWILKKLVKLGLRLAYAFIKVPKPKKSIPMSYYYVGKSLDDIQSSFKKEIVQDFEISKIEDYSEIILDANDLSYKEIISEIDKGQYPKSSTFKIRPKNSRFIIGSNDRINRGEVIEF